jgi:hypothetical protein
VEIVEEEIDLELETGKDRKTPKKTTREETQAIALKVSTCSTLKANM